MKAKYEKIGEIILKFNEVEFYLKQIIILYLQPKKEHDQFYSQILFNNSIIDFSGKIKLFKNLNLETKWLKSKNLDEFLRNIYYLASVRNSLVHTENAFQIDKDERGDFTQISHIIDFFKTDGSLNILKLDEVYEEFLKRHTNVKESLITIIKRLK